MPDPRRPNLNEVDAIVRAARPGASLCQADEIVRAHARIVKGVLMVDNTTLAAAVPIAAQKLLFAALARIARLAGKRLPA